MSSNNEQEEGVGWVGHQLEPGLRDWAVSVAYAARLGHEMPLQQQQLWRHHASSVAGHAPNQPASSWHRGEQS